MLMPSPTHGTTLHPFAALSDTHDRSYRAIFEAVGVGMARLSLHGRFTEVNQRFADITGRSRESLIGLHAHDITHPEDITTDQAQVEALLEGRQDRYALEKRYLRPDGATVWAVLNVVLLRDDAHKPLQLIAVIEDISERMRMQEAMSSARTAERASKAKTEFLSRMSHELRTPLNAMLGFAQLLRVDPRFPLNDSQRQKVNHIEQAGAHLLAMLTDVLDLSRIEAGSLPMCIEALPVGPVVDEAVALIGHQAAAAQLQLSHVLPPPDLYTRADQVRLRQVLVNLLTNAIKYNKSGGRVMIEAMAVQHSVVFTVTDTGKGMSQTQLDHLFEPFNRLGAERTSVEGTGIGLVIVKRLVDLMQGRIEVSSSPCVGTSFRVWLPLAQTPEESTNGPESTRSAFGCFDDGTRQHLTVLYAEDNMVNVELVRQVMRMRPQWHMEVARCGQEAIAMALSSPPDLLLLDMHLGDMSGLDVSDTLNHQPSTAGIPRVALSADVMPDQIREARDRGFVDYLTKPLDVARLLKLLDRCASSQG